MVTQRSFSQRFPAVTKVERQWVIVFGVIIMAITTLPYLIGFLDQSNQSIFTGFVFGVEDGNSYIAKMLTGAMGAWLFRTPYTTMPQHGVLIFLPYLLMGKLIGPSASHTILTLLYHICRFLAGIFMILATYDFMACFLDDRGLRRFGTALASLGGGLGWVLVLVGQQEWLGSLPLEFYSPESFGFLGLFGVPHLAMARAFLLYSLVLYLRAIVNDCFNEGSSHIALWLGLSWALAGLMQPLTIVVIGAVILCHLTGMAVWQVVRGRRGDVPQWSKWQRLVWLVVKAAILPGIYLFYNVIAILQDPFLRVWSAQNVIKSPHPFHYLLAYGLLVPFALVGGRYLLRANPWKGWLPVGWVVLLPILAYAPVNLQRRLPEGIWVSWVILAMAAFEGWSKRRPAEIKQRRFVSLGLSLVLFLSTMFLLSGAILTVKRVESPLFRNSNEVATFEYLRDVAENRAVVLAAYETGNALPAWAPVRVMIGHGPESANQALLIPEVQGFYSSTTDDAQRLEFIWNYDVQFVIWGPLERKLGNWNPSQASYLELVFEQDGYDVYRVKQGSP